MISKRIQPKFWFNDEPMVSLLDVHSRGIDGKHMDKFASQRSPLADVNIRPEKGYAFVHVITTGAGERYGCNNNADFFNKEAREWVFPHPISKSRKSMTLRGGLKDYHNTFMKYGAVYREHNNSKKGGTPLGDIHSEAYNPHMERGELILKLPLDKWASELDSLSKNKPFFFSMGCGVPYDICSACGNQAPTRNQYCSHLQFQKMAMDDDGNMVFAINDQPHFHDISEVVKPADRIAFSLAKVASATGQVDSEDLTDLFLPHSVIQKLARAEEGRRLGILEKLSAIEKRIKAEGMLLDDSNLAAGFAPISEKEETELVEKLAKFDPDSLFFYTHKHKVLLPPRIFTAIVMRKEARTIPGIEGIGRALPMIFSELKEAGDLEVLSDGTYNGTRSYGLGPELATQHLADSLSLNDEPMRRRIIRNSVRGHEKVASLASRENVSPESKVLAKEYAKYQLSFLSQADDRFVHRVVVHNLTM